MKRPKIMLALACACLALAPLQAQVDQPAEEHPAHKELRAVRDSLIDAINRNDRDRLLQHLHKNVIVTWLDGRVSRTPAEVKAYYDEMMTGDKRKVQSIIVQPTVERLSDLYGDNTAVVYGYSDDRFKLTSGLEFQVPSRWTATLIEEEGQWLITSFHASAGMFDNPLLNAAQRMTYWAAGIAGGVGFVLGFLTFRLRRKRKE